MQKTVAAAINLAPKVVAAGTIEGKFRVWLVNETGAVVSQQDTDVPNVTFPNVDAGTYKVMAIRLDLAGGALSDPVASDPFTITDLATVTINVPASIAVSVE